MTVCIEAIPEGCNYVTSYVTFYVYGGDMQLKHFCVTDTISTKRLLLSVGCILQFTDMKYIGYIFSSRIEGQDQYQEDKKKKNNSNSTIISAKL